MSKWLVKIKNILLKLIENPNLEIEEKQSEKNYCNLTIKVISVVITNKENHSYIKSSSFIAEIVQILKISIQSESEI